MRRPGPDVLGLKTEVETVENEAFVSGETTYLYFADPRFAAMPRVVNEPVVSTHPLQPNPIPEDTKTLWLAALRSGEYFQATQALASQHRGESQWGYCCLGVLCDVQGLPFQIIPDRYSGPHKRYVGSDDSFGEEYLPSSMWDIISEDAQKVLAHFNDSGWNFEQIATLIEAAF